MKPEKLGSRASHLWDDITNTAELDAAGKALLEDACRTVDIIDKLTAALRSSNQEWIRLSEEAEEIAPDAVKISIVVNPVLGEVRQQRMALRQMLNHLKVGVAKAKPEGDTKSAFDKIIESL